MWVVKFRMAGVAEPVWLLPELLFYVLLPQSVNVSVTFICCLDKLCVLFLLLFVYSAFWGNFFQNQGTVLSLLPKCWHYYILITYTFLQTTVIIQFTNYRKHLIDGLWTVWYVGAIQLMHNWTILGHYSTRLFIDCDCNFFFVLIWWHQMTLIR